MADTNETLAKLQEGVQQLLESQDWAEFLAMQARFHNYSFGNVMLILLQNPHASRVAGFKAWLDMGRHVRKGEHGIAILASLVKKLTVTDEETGEETKTARTYGFRTVFVFDVSQTEGQELPTVAHTLTGDSARGLLSAALAVCPVPVTFGPPAEFHGANGNYNPADQTIHIREDLDVNQQAKTLLHEWAHHETPGLADRPTDEGEVVAESCAYVVASHFGLDTAAYSLGYLAGWSRANPKEIQRVAGDVQKIADRLINAMEQTAPAEENPAA